MRRERRPLPAQCRVLGGKAAPPRGLTGVVVAGSEDSLSQRAPRRRRRRECGCGPLAAALPCRPRAAAAMGSLLSRRIAGVEDIDIQANSAYRYPPKSGEGRGRGWGAGLRAGPGAARRPARASAGSSARCAAPLRVWGSLGPLPPLWSRRQPWGIGGNSERGSGAGPPCRHGPCLCANAGLRAGLGPRLTDWLAAWPAGLSFCGVIYSFLSRKQPSGRSDVSLPYCTHTLVPRLGTVLRPAGCQGCDGAGVPLGFVAVADLKQGPAVVAPCLVAGLPSGRMGVFHEPFPRAVARELPALHSP